MKSCFFIGHRDAGEKILPYIKDAAEKLIRQSEVTEFYVGGYGSFDRLAGQAVMELKWAYPHIQLYRIIPYHPADRKIELPPGYDGTYYPDGLEFVPRRYAISKANRIMIDQCDIMIDQCDIMIVYVWHPASNASQFLEYARKREKKGLLRIIRLECR